MKRLVIIIPFILFVILNACGNPGMPPEGGIYVTYTPTIALTPTPGPDGSQIVASLNQFLEGTEAATPLDQLEHTMSARYQVLDVSFPVENDGTITFQVNVNCECAANGQCCSHEQTFVETMRAMYPAKDLVIRLVPGNVKYMKVFCSDHSSQVVIMNVLWEDVKSFFYGHLTGYQLASRVQHN